VGNTYARASGKCEDGTPAVKEGVCFGDFANLSLGLDISATQLTNILDGYAALGGATKTETTPAGDLVTVPGTPTQDLVDLVTGLVPSSGSATTPDDSPTTEPTPSPTPTASKGGICSLLGTCRTAVASAPAGDLGQLLVEPAVAP
jgi:phospholipid/cholesterol/gamma-HCH transport system substrate-binding protein